MATTVATRKMYSGGLTITDNMNEGEYGGGGSLVVYVARSNDEEEERGVADVVVDVR